MPESIRKGTEEAKRTMIRVPLREGPHPAPRRQGAFGAGKVLLRAAPLAPASSPAVRCAPSSRRSASRTWWPSRLGTNPYNMVRATFEALKAQSSPRSVAAKRGIKVADLVERRQDGASAPEAIES